MEASHHKSKAGGSKFDDDQIPFASRAKLDHASGLESTLQPQLSYVYFYCLFLSDADADADAPCYAVLCYAVHAMLNKGKPKLQIQKTLELYARDSVHRGRWFNSVFSKVAKWQNDFFPN